MKPKILYKYKPWNEYTEKIITDKEVFCPNPDLLNDPFDCKAEIFSSQFEVDLKEQMMGLHISSFFLFYMSESSNFTTDLEKKRLRKEFSKRKGAESIFNFVQNYLKERNPFAPPLTDSDEMIKAFEKQSKKLGVFSLTEIPNHMLMWAHYADQHKGIAIGFERNKNNDLGNIEKCRRVNYVNDFPKSDISEMKQEMGFSFGEKGVEKSIDLDISSPLIKRAFFEKAECWNYEEEWRLLEMKDGVRELPGKIFEIIFGYNCPDKLVEDIILLTKKNIKNAVRFYKIETKKNSFELIVKRI